MTGVGCRSLAAVALALLAACSEGTGPTPAIEPRPRPRPEPDPPRVEVLSGAGVPDTVLANLAQPLVVEVRGEGGVLAAGVQVMYEALRNPAGTGEPTVTISRPAAPPIGHTVADTTRTDGRSTLLVRMGRVAGDGVIRITVPSLGLADTATYTIRPGAAAGVRVSPGDTAVLADVSYPLAAFVTDRFGNRRDDAVTVTAGPGVSYSGGTVTAREVGRRSLVARGAQREDTARVSVVPRGTLAAVEVGGIAIFHTDGSALVRLALQGARRPAWAPSGNEIAFDPSVPQPRIQITDLSGATRALVPAGTFSGGSTESPRYGRDGAWVYFSHGPPFARIYRIRPDGGGLEKITTDDLSTEIHPSPSPDGARVTFSSNRGFPYRIGVRDVGTGVRSPVSLEGYLPVWSPVGDVIAYSGSEDFSNGSVRVVRPDGTGMRVISKPGVQYTFGIDFSPDGRWVVARNYLTATLELIEVQTGETLPLPFTLGKGYSTPAWKPE